MSINRYYLKAEEWDQSGVLILRGNEARHCVEVMRTEVGEKVSIFDGEGTEAHCEIIELNSNETKAKVITKSKEPQNQVQLILAQAIPKGKNMDLILQKATELGVTEIIPVISERTIVKISNEEAQKKKEKWERVVLEACKQCGQNWLPKVSDIIDFKGFIKLNREFDLKLIASLQNDSKRLKDWLEESKKGGQETIESAVVVVGPEGDYTPAEIALAKGESYFPLSLGPIVLRSETAAMHCLSILSHELR